MAVMVQDMTGVYEPSTINRTIGTVKKALTLAWDIGLTRENHGLRIKRVPDPATRDITVTLEQAKAIADKASQQVRAAIWIALYTGMRRGEILALRKQDIGPDAITVRAGSTKTLRTRTVPIVAPLKPWLACVPLAVNFEGLKTGFRRAREAAGLAHVTFHDLRRSCGTMMVQAGVDLYVVMQGARAFVAGSDREALRASANRPAAGRTWSRHSGENWWAVQGSNLRLSPCECDALPLS
jgi:integrase